MAVVALPNLDALATKLGLPKHVLTAYIFCADRHYKQFRIRKRSGRGNRLISAPSQRLKGIQRWILSFILRQVDVEDASTAFRPNCSIKLNAQQHEGKAFVFNTDLKDFFPSITVKRVVGLFKSLGYNSDVAWALGRLTTHKGSLPQGGPCSPDIANIICRGLDRRLTKLCEMRKWAYTRYCDDITISGNGGMDCDQAAILEIIKDEGFEINARKTRIIRKGGRQVVTGLVVNKRTNAPRTIRKNIRAIFHQARISPSQFKSRSSELQGHIAYLKMLNPKERAIPKYRQVLVALAD